MHVNARIRGWSCFRLEGNLFIISVIRLLVIVSSFLPFHYDSVHSSTKNSSCWLTVQEAASARLQSGLQYKSDAKITDAINRLEYQLRMRNLKLHEEKKIVAEIDTLQRSKKDLGQVTFCFSLQCVQLTVIS